MSNLMVLGSVNADHVLRVKQFPRPGETLHGYQYRVVPGGKGANQAVAAARMGADIGFVASVGDDDFANGILRQFAADGINIDGIVQHTDTPTGIAMIQVADSGENSIVISAEANGLLLPELVEKYLNKIKSSRYFLTQLETPLAGIVTAIEAAHQGGSQVVLNPAPARVLPDELLEQVNIITPNETEAEVLTGIKICNDTDAAEAAQILHQKGIDTVLITLGSKGVWLSRQGKGKIVPGFRVEATDTTAAGDTFNGALVAALLEDKPLEEAIRFAHAAAAISVTRFGAQTSIPTREEVDLFLEQNPPTVDK